MFMNPPFPRPAEPPIKPQYIVLFKGDDSDFQGNQSVDVVIDTELDTTGMKAHFRFMDFVQDFESIPENKTLSLVFPNAKTSEFPLGAADATLRFEDASGKFRTVSNRIHVVVTNSVHEAYDNEDSQSITVTVKGTVTWDMIEGKPTFAPVATSGSYNDLTDKPTIPTPVTIDPALSPTSENPVQNKAVAAALSSKLDGAAAYPEWDATISYWQDVVCSYKGRLYISTQLVPAGVPPDDDDEQGLNYWTDVTIDDMKQDTLLPEQMAAVNSGATAAKVATWDGYAAQIAAKASLADLPYRLVTPGEWEFSGDLTGFTDLSVYYDSGRGLWFLDYEQDGYPGQSDGVSGDGTELSVTFIRADDTWHITATRPSLPGHLLDRANNLIDATTGNVTLTLPAYQEGKVRDLLVACTIGLDANDEPWSVIFQGGDGEEISFKGEGDDAASAMFPVPDAAGDWWYSLTERAPHVFAVSLKQLQSVSQPTQTQGGS